MKNFDVENMQEMMDDMADMAEEMADV